MTAISEVRDPRRRRVVLLAVVGLLVLGVLVAMGIVRDRRHEATPERLTYCGGRHYLRGERETRADAEASGPLVAIGRTPGGAVVLGPEHPAVVAGETLCSTVVWVAYPDDAHLTHYTLSGGP